jgi:lauroyl/myristoyl acyltransferase
VRSPLLDLAAAGAVPALLGLPFRGLGGQTVAQAIEALFGPLSVRARLELVRQVTATELRNRCLTQLIRLAGLGSVARLLRCVDVRSLEASRASSRGTLAITWHYGAKAALGPAFRQLGMSALLFTRTPRDLPAPPGAGASAARLEFLVVGEPRDRVAHLTRALRHLASGGLVGIAVDGQQGAATLEIPFLGRRLSVTRGPAVLARLTGAPMIPVLATWARDGAIEVRSFDPLRVPPAAGHDAEGWDRIVLTEAMQFFETVIRADPGQLRAALLPHYCRASELVPCPGSSTPPPAAPNSP